MYVRVQKDPLEQIFRDICVYMHMSTYLSCRRILNHRGWLGPISSCTILRIRMPASQRIKAHPSPAPVGGFLFEEKMREKVQS